MNPNSFKPASLSTSWPGYLFNCSRLPSVADIFSGLTQHTSPFPPGDKDSVVLNKSALPAMWIASIWKELSTQWWKGKRLFLRSFSTSWNKSKISSLFCFWMLSCLAVIPGAPATILWLEGELQTLCKLHGEWLGAEGTWCHCWTTQSSNQL